MEKEEGMNLKAEIIELVANALTGDIVSELNEYFSDSYGSANRFSEVHPALMENINRQLKIRLAEIL